MHILLLGHTYTHTLVCFTIIIILIIITIIIMQGALLDRLAENDRGKQTQLWNLQHIWLLQNSSLGDGTITSLQGLQLTVESGV